MDVQMVTISFFQAMNKTIIIIQILTWLLCERTLSFLNVLMPLAELNSIDQTDPKKNKNPSLGLKSPIITKVSQITLRKKPKDIQT